MAVHRPKIMQQANLPTSSDFGLAFKDGLMYYPDESEPLQPITASASHSFTPGMWQYEFTGSPNAGVAIRGTYGIS